MIHNKKLHLADPGAILPSGHVTLDVAGLVPTKVKDKVTRGGLVVIEWLDKPETRDTDNREMLSVHANMLVEWARINWISRKDLEENMEWITDACYG